jgi:hypothetical protein
MLIFNKQFICLTWGSHSPDWDMTRQHPIKCNREFVRNYFFCFLVVTCLAYTSTLNMDPVYSSETSVNFHMCTWSHIPYRNLNSCSICQQMAIIFFLLTRRVRSTGIGPLVCLLYHAHDDRWVWRAVAGVRIDRGERSTRRNPVSMLLCAPQIKNELGSK